MQKNVEHILKVLNEMFPNANIELHHKNHFELLIAVVLSAQATDVSVNKVTPQLFEMFPTPHDLAQAEVTVVEQIIKTIGLYQLSKQLVELYDAEIPQKREQLEALPGVGRKTANVVLSNAFGIPALAVDTHVMRVSIRLGLAKKGDTALAIESKLNRKIPRELWSKVHHQFIFFGRYHCLAKNPKCQICPLYDVCRYENKEK